MFGSFIGKGNMGADEVMPKGVFFIRRLEKAFFPRTIGEKYRIFFGEIQSSLYSLLRNFS